MTKCAVVLLSGRVDSATAAVANRDGHQSYAYALSFGYGQRHAVELDAARRVANHRRRNTTKDIRLLTAHLLRGYKRVGQTARQER